MMWSEAIRLGSAVTGKLEGGLVTGDGKFTCAIGAGFVGCGFKVDGAHMSPLAVTMTLRRIGAKCPICNGSSNLCDVIICLNDRHDWSRERIADWIVTSGHDFEAIPEPVVTQSVHEAEQVPV